MKTAWKEEEEKMGVKGILMLSVWEMWKFNLERFGWRGMVIWFIVPITVLTISIVFALLLLFFIKEASLEWFFIGLGSIVLAGPMAFYYKKAYFKKRGIHIRSEP